MARHPVINASQHTIATIDLESVLERLEKKVLSPNADPKLQRSSYERKRTAATLEYARTLLIRLEHDTSRKQSQARKAADKSTLTRQRALLKRLTDRMHDLDQTGDDNEDFYGPEDGEPIISSEDEAAPLTSANAANPPSHDKKIQPSSPPSTLRNRFQPSKPSDQLTTTPFSPSSSDPSQNHVQRLQNNDSERAELTSALVAMAQSLKGSAKQFQTSLGEDDAALRGAAEGLDKNETGMEAAGKRMGMLKRMSEGQGLWGRLMLYAWIFGLWVAAILLVFVGPKLRF